MILESLVKYYEVLVEKRILPKPGWSQVDVSFALDIDRDGSLLHVVSLRKQEGKKLIPQKMSVPNQVKRSSGIVPNYLCDNASYFLGIDNKGKPERSKKCFLAAKELHNKNLPRDNEASLAVLNFFRNWEIDQADSCVPLQEYKDEIAKAGNIVFLYDGKYVQEVETIKKCWDKSFENNDKEKCICGITGRRDSLAVLHPSIKKIRNSQAAGASLVSFNGDAFTSYGKEQGGNAQTGEYAAFAYGEALNYLTSELKNNYIGDTALLFYSVSGEREYQDAFNAIFFGDNEYYSKEDLEILIKKISAGQSVEFDTKQLDPNMEFYLLGLAPNNARLSVRFFYKGTFGEFVENIRVHQERLSVETSKGGVGNIPIWQLMQETCREGAETSHILAGELIRSIIGNTRYPATLINAIDLRIRADHVIGARRAAIIKAYYLKNPNKNIPEEVLAVGLNKETDHVPYNLGRLFAILERVQEAANPGLNATIKDKYFGGASSTPVTIMPKLIDLAQKHLRKLNPALKVFYDKQIGEILERIPEFPSVLSMPERGAFQLGYYHQMQEMFNSKKGEE